MSHNMTQAITLLWAINSELGKLRQGDHEFETSLDYIIRISQRKSSRKKKKTEKKHSLLTKRHCRQCLSFKFSVISIAMQEVTDKQRIPKSSLERSVVLSGHRPTRLLCGWLLSAHNNPPTGHLHDEAGELETESTVLLYALHPKEVVWKTWHCC